MSSENPKIAMDPQLHETRHLRWFFSNVADGLQLSEDISLKLQANRILSSSLFFDVFQQEYYQVQEKDTNLIPFFLPISTDEENNNADTTMTSIHNSEMFKSIPMTSSQRKGDEFANPMVNLPKQLYLFGRIRFLYSMETN